MKSFTEYLMESKEEKKYSFKIKIAGDLPENCEDVMETALQKYQVAKFAKTKTTPIQAKLRDFPAMENAQVSIFDIELEYPTTSQVLHNYLIQETGVDSCCIKVRSPLEEAEAELNNENQEMEKGKALLTQDYAKENNQNAVGDKGVSNFLKDLAKVRKEQVQYKGVNDAILAKKAPKEKSNEQVKPAAGKSVMGSVKGNTK